MAKPQIIKDLKRSFELARDHMLLSQRITEWFEERYGPDIIPAAVDCDPIIDSMDCGVQGPLPTIERIDEEMAKCGAYPLKKEGNADAE
ncbi:TPA: hypothetical protein ACPZRZ_003962 [Yersinia enterocolitica]|uniref:hypothetical protein n=1 Tax=Yersinia enterocolitica TaxID=630 RepID=UPI0005EA0035|nr:hypothetical protein [Yersinia enterocolitica]ELI7991670.1 hypothetical protein [Yersinia enterocolitica]ELW7355818.1 hypothetical protein [Yersinia enterocolitica]ELX2282865.1 hypothetical protein [Yersinia enterocolitica]EMA2896558.1 hypothetical protein [Yersinia enterocolitica]EMB6582920.1 hypothetical protein [Yersinia enterocolitica]